MSLEEIVKKIKGTKDLRSLVRVMKAIAAANIREYGASQKALHEYFRSIELGLQVLIQFGGREIALKDETVSSNKTGSIVFTAALGLCGQFNHQIVSFFQKNKNPSNEQAILILGDRGQTLIEHQTVEEYLSYPNTIDEMALFLQELLAKINHWIETRGIHQIFLFYNKLDSPITYSPVMVRLNPPEKSWFEDLRKRTWTSRSRPLFTIERDSIFSSLIQEYFFASLYKAVIESYMSENLNRLQSMVVAEKHIDDFMGDLKNKYHQQWQDAITEEILDIESGFEALYRT